MSQSSATFAAIGSRTGPAFHWWRVLIPVLITLVIAASPPPPGLAQHAWYYFAIFSGVVAALVTEPLPNPAIGLIGVSLTALMSRFVLFAPADIAKPGFKLTSQTINWALSGFANTTVWLVAAAFMFALGYQKTGLGRRIALLLVRGLGRNTLMVGYATAFADAVLAPFTPSNTARSAGTIFPVVSSPPALYDSHPNDPSSRRFGGYIIWTTFAAGCVTSSMFITACAPNLLAVDFIRTTVHVNISFLQWMQASLPFTVPLLLLVPLLSYVLYAPEIKRSSEVPAWAGKELRTMGAISGNEIALGLVVTGAILLWVFGLDYVDATLTALTAIAVMLVCRIISWDDVAKHHAAWTTLVLLATLVTMADGLARCGFIKWFADFVAANASGHSPTLMLVVLVAIYFVSHYMFASLTAHTTAMMPMMLAAGMGIPGLPAPTLAMALALTTGLMGVITPYATGPAPVYYNSGYVPAGDFWRLGTIFGLIFLGALLAIGVPLLAMGA
jgi:L-tartrate/succinate antiporter